MKTLLRGVGLGLPLVAGLIAMPGAQAAPGDDGDIKVHKVTTRVNDERTNSQVCRFYLDAFNFDKVRTVLWEIHETAPTGDDRVMRGELRMRDGRGFTYPMALPRGHYKVTWTYPRGKAAGESKPFQVICDNPWTPPRPDQPKPAAGPTPSGAKPAASTPSSVKPKPAASTPSSVKPKPAPAKPTSVKPKPAPAKPTSVKPKPAPAKPTSVKPKPAPAKPTGGGNSGKKTGGGGTAVK
ncbi:hypothetical protein ACIRF8_35140 [Streptomyces sp. NPDC102406]|uniref:hypothetical protein n=1 Tax=Streptomyces sp. NPDC102406 TaxID=3366171 RepID=UPI003812E706